MDIHQNVSAVDVIVVGISRVIAFINLLQKGIQLLCIQIEFGDQAVLLEDVLAQEMEWLAVGDSSKSEDIKVPIRVPFQQFGQRIVRSGGSVWK